MKTKFNLRKVNLVSKDQELIEKKLTRLDKFFSENAVATVTVNKIRENMIAEIAINDKGMMFRAERSDKNVTACVDEIIDLLTRQIRKNKTRLEKRLYQGAQMNFDADYIDQEEYVIARKKQITLSPMETEDAILEMNMLNHSFFLYKDIKTNNVCLVYKRNDGDYSVIETE